MGECLILLVLQKFIISFVFKKHEVEPIPKNKLWIFVTHTNGKHDPFIIIFMSVLPLNFGNKIS
jgi:hypothetical protein